MTPEDGLATRGIYAQHKLDSLGYLKNKKIQSWGGREVGVDLEGVRGREWVNMTKIDCMKFSLMKALYFKSEAYLI